jgi:hypothetical protein
MFVQSKDESVQENPQRPDPTEPTNVEGKVESVHAVRVNAASSPSVESSHSAGARGLAELFGLDIRAALLTVFVDMMLFTGDLLSLGILIPVAIAVSIVLAFIVFRMQVAWYGDSRESALIKCLIVALLTAIPVPLGPLVAIPGGIIGIIHAGRRGTGNGSPSSNKVNA